MYVHYEQIPEHMKWHQVGSQTWFMLSVGLNTPSVDVNTGIINYVLPHVAHLNTTCSAATFRF